MVWARRFWLRLQTLFHRRRIADELDDEIQFHLEQQVAENTAAGMSPEEARYTAMRAFGNPTVLKEETRDTWGWIAVEQIVWLWAAHVTQEFRLQSRGGGHTGAGHGRERRHLYRN